MTSPDESKSSQVQFGIGRLMMLTVAVAVVMTIAVRINASHIVQGLLAGYLFFFAIWAVIRGPGVYADLANVNERRRQLKQRRSDLEREISQWRQIKNSSQVEKESQD